MRVLHLVKTTTGASWAVRQLRELQELGVEVHIALPDRQGSALAYTRLGIPVHVLDIDPHLRQPWRLPGQLLALRKLVKTLQPDLVHSHFVGTTLLMRLALKALPVPRIFQVPGPLHLEHGFFRRAERLLADQQDYWIATCEWTRRAYLQQGIPADRLFLSYYGVDPLPQQPVDDGSLRRLLGCGESTRLIGMVAYMYPPKSYLGQKRGLKGHEDLIDALAQVIKQYPDTLGVFIGGAWNGAHDYEAAIRNYAATRLGKHAVFLGTRQDVMSLYPGLDMAVHPSHSENVGGASESLLLGVPTISTRVGGFPDLVKQNQTGLLVEPAAPEQLADAILYYLDHPHEARQHAQAGQQLASHLFDVRRTAAEVNGYYRQVIEHAAQPARHAGSEV
ncbi:MAG: glycosyltransferase family 4 protein [Thiolinea sp.]